MPWNTQTLAQIAGALRRARLPHDVAPVGVAAEDDSVHVEHSFDDDDVAGLPSMSSVAHHHDPTSGACKSAQQVVRLARPGEAVVGAADPRTVGAAVGV